MDAEAGRHEQERPDGTVKSATQMGRRILSAQELFADRQEIEIHLGDAVYRLRLTRAGKLILTK